MQKNFRDYTVNELLEKGFKVEVNKHRVSEEEARKALNEFEGVKQSSYHLKGGTLIVEGWKEKFNVTFFTK